MFANWLARVIDWLFLLTHRPREVRELVEVNGHRAVFRSIDGRVGQVRCSNRARVFVRGDVRAGKEPALIVDGSSLLDVRGNIYGD